MINTTVNWKDFNSLYSNSCIPFKKLLYSSFYTIMIFSKSPIIIIKHWRNIANYEIYIQTVAFLSVNCCICHSILKWFFSKSPIISLNIEEISLIMKSTFISTCWNYPPVVMRNPKTTIDVEYEIQQSHISLLIPNHSHASWQVSNKLVYKTHPLLYITNKIPV